MFESEWKEFYEDLHHNMVQWFKVAPTVNLVYLCIFSKLSDNRIEGHLELWGRGENGDEILLKEKVLKGSTPFKPRYDLLIVIESVAHFSCSQRRNRSRLLA